MRSGTLKSTCIISLVISVDRNDYIKMPAKCRIRNRNLVANIQHAPNDNNGDAL